MSTFLIDWENIQDLRYTTPLSIFIYNKIHYVKSWAGVWYQTCLLSEEKFGDISSFKINGRKRDMFSNDPINLIKPRRLKQSGYVELNYSARDTVVNIKELLMYFGMILSEVRIVVLAEIGSQAEMPASPVKTVKKTIISTKPAVSKPALSAFTYDEAEMIYQECMKQFQRKASAASVLSKLSLRIDKPQNKLVMARHQMMHLLSDGKLGLPCTDEVLRKVFNSHKESPGTKSTITEDPDNRKPKSADPIAVSVSSFETGFYDWAKEKYPNQLSDLYFSFSSINYHLKTQGFVDKNIFEVTQPEKAKKLIEMVQRSTLGKNGKFAIALSLYSSYISHHSPKNNTKAPAESENKSSVTMTPQDKKPVVCYLENDLISSIKKCNIRYLDERPSGHLWIFGAVIPFVRECKKKGVIFNFDTYFGSNTEFRAKDGWYTDQDFNTAASRTTDSITSRAQITTKSVQSSRANDSEKYLEVIRKDFCRGFTFGSSIELRRFRKLWYSHFGEDLSADDHKILSTIRSLTITSGGKSYLPETMLSENIRNTMLKYIAETFESGVSSIYFSALFDKFSDDLLNSQINNSEMLSDYLKAITENKYYFRTHCLSNSKTGESDVKSEIQNYLRNAGSVCSKERICEALSHIPKERISQTLSREPCFIHNSKGEYLLADIVDINESELEKISSMINSIIDEKDYVTDSELYDMIQKRTPEIIERYSFLTVAGFRDFLEFKLDRKFHFNNKIISKENNLSITKVFADFCKHNSRFTIDQLDGLKDDLNTQINFEQVYANSMRISASEFISLDSLNFDIQAVDSAIDNFFSKDYLLFSNIGSFMSFPYAGYSWNSYLLESYVFHFSKKFSLSHNSFSKGLTGAIVRKGSELEEFRVLFAHAAADSNVPLSEKDVMSWAVANELTATRRYSDISYVLSSAKKLRNSKG